MKLLVIGLGSMGKRRIRLLKEHFNEIAVYGADPLEERREQAQAQFGIPAYADYRVAVEHQKPEAALVCTAPASHGRIILDCLRAGLAVFSEMNLLWDDYEEIIKTARDKGLNLFLSSTQLYRKEIEQIKDGVQSQQGRVNYRYHVGQYLPDWHPWESYKDFFVSEKRTDGCRELFAAELPWMLQTFGEVAEIHVVKDKLSSLELDFPDNYYVLFTHRNGNKGVLIIDIISRLPESALLIYSENMHLLWNGTPGSLFRYNIGEKRLEPVETYQKAEIEQDSRYSEKVIENAYAEELRVFIGQLRGKQSQVRYTFEKDIHTLHLIDRIEGIGE